MIIKKMFICFIVFTFLFTPNIINASETELELSSEHIVVYNLDEHRPIYQQNADEKVSIASITKVMSAITVLDHCDDLDEMITIKEKVFDGTEGYSMMGLQVGDCISIKDLLYGLMLPSGADAANALALYTAGSIPKFAEMMNKKAKELKMNDSHFDNPVGADSKKNYATANDLTKLLLYGLDNPVFKEIYTTRKYRIEHLDIDLESTLLYYQENYDFDISKILGSKTGFTYDAGPCLSSIAEYEGIHYLMIVLGSDVEKRYSAVQDSLTLYDYYAKNYGIHQIVDKDDLLLKLPIKHGFEKEYCIYAQDDIKAYLKNDFQAADIQISFNGVSELTYKIKEQDKLGTITIRHQDEVLHQFEVILQQKLYYYDVILIAMSIILSVGLLLWFIMKKYLKKKVKNIQR